MLRSEIIPSELARELHLDVANLNAYLMRGETQRFTLDTAPTIAPYLTAELKKKKEHKKKNNRDKIGDEESIDWLRQEGPYG